MSNSHMQVCHAWAHQTGRNCKGFNIFYEGDTIYSYGYHFPIARITAAHDGSPVVLFTTNTRSVSTSKHKTYTSRAIPNSWPVIPTEDVLGSNRAADHEAALLRAKDAADKTRRARVHGDMHLNDAKREVDTANRISELFQLGKPLVTMESLGIALADIEARLAPAREAKRVAELERNAKRAIERQAQREAWREAWLSGESRYFSGVDEHGGAYLRVKDDRIETSRGAEVPLDHAVRAFKFIKSVRERNEAWRANGHTLKIGLYAATSIDPCGDLTIGCHLVRWPEIERVARLLGLD